MAKSVTITTKQTSKPAQKVAETKTKPVAAKNATASKAVQTKSTPAKESSAKPATKPVSAKTNSAKPVVKTASASSVKSATAVKPAAQPKAQPKVEAKLVAKAAKPTAKVSQPTAETKPAKTSALKPAESTKNNKAEKVNTERQENAKAVEKNKNLKPKKAEKANKNKSNNKQGTRWQRFKAWCKRTAEKLGPKRVIAIVAVTVFIIGILLGLLIGFLLRINNGKTYINAYASKTLVGYSAEYLGTTKRNVPTETKNQGLSAYPKYGYTLNSVIGTSQDRVDARNALIRESWNLTTINTTIGTDGSPTGTYDRMDKDGNLYLRNFNTPSGANTPNQLYKHSASVGMYLGNVADDEPGVIKRLTYQGRYNTPSYNVTGLYAPAGEVIKVELTKKDMDATGGGMTIYIGQALYNSKANNIWVQKNAMNRMPVILNTWGVNTNTATYDEERGVYTAYVGSFWGGPIYVGNESGTFSVTISGAVNYSHFILGYTTPEEFAMVSKSSAPYFDLEVWETGVLHSGPKKYAQSFSFDDLYKAGILWEKISTVSTMVYPKRGVVFIYDPFVAAGAAVAFPAQNSVNCPMGWMTGSLNYNAFVKSGSWGNLHEYNHNFQKNGLAGIGNGEVSNNALNLVEYSLFTKISSSRKLGSGGDGMSGWNRYTSASWALGQTLDGAGDNLRYYANLLHSFGPETFMAAHSKNGNYFNNWCEATHMDLSYFFNNFGNISAGVTSYGTDRNYPMFVPVASIYQTGCSYTYDGQKKYVETMQPYVIPYGYDFTIDLREHETANGRYDGIWNSGSIVIPTGSTGFSYKIKSISQPANGTITQIADKVYNFTPNSTLRSGKIYVTLEITKNDGAFNVADVDLVLEFEQTHEMTKNVTQRTTYSYTSDKYASAVDAYNAGFAGYESVVSGDNVNPKNPNTGKVVQNCNSDVWFLDKLQDDAVNVNDGIVASNIKSQIVVLSGKMYATEQGKYRIALRGRERLALYVSRDGGKTYELAGSYDSNAAAASSTNSAFKTSAYDDKFTFSDGTYKLYKDYDLEAGQWVYYKAVLIRYSGELRGAYVGVGWGKWTPEQGTVKVDENNNTVYNEDGSPVIEGYKPASISVSYATAYRATYESINAEFKSEYFNERTYTKSYTGDLKELETKQTLLSVENFQPSNASYEIGNLFDGNINTNIHSLNRNSISESNPFVITVMLDRTITATQMVIYGNTQQNGNSSIPTSFNLYGSMNGKDFYLIGKYTNKGVSGANKAKTVTVDFLETSFCVYRLEVTKTDGDFVAMNRIGFKYRLSLPSGNWLSCDELSYKGSWQTVQTRATFGHAYQGGKHATASFEFTGKRFAILSSTVLGGDFEVYIDGKKVESVEIKKQDGTTIITYISPLLSSGKHLVSLYSPKSMNIDSIVTWK